MPGGIAVATILAWTGWFSLLPPFVTEADFYELIAGRYLKIRSQRGLEDVYEVLGQNLAGDHLHIVYRMLSDSRLRVFHISRMTDKQKRRYQRTRR